MNGRFCFFFFTESLRSSVRFASGDNPVCTSPRPVLSGHSRGARGCHHGRCTRGPQRLAKPHVLTLPGVQGGRQVNVLAGAWLCAGGFPEHVSLNLQRNPRN